MILNAGSMYGRNNAGYFIIKKNVIVPGSSMQQNKNCNIKNYLIIKISNKQANFIEKINSIYEI